MSTTPERPALDWDHRDDLPQEVRDVLRRPPGSVVAIVATVDGDGAPRTAAFGAMRAPSATQLRFGCRRTHDTFANIERDGRVMVSLYAAPNVAVGIRGRARVVRDHLDAMPDNALIEIEVESVKNDTVPGLPLSSGITYAMPEKHVSILHAVNAELDAPLSDG